jgi:hypothetical protein
LCLCLVPCALYPVPCCPVALCHAPCALCLVPSALYRVPCALCLVALCLACLVPCALCIVPCVLRALCLCIAPCALYLVPCCPIALLPCAHTVTHTARPVSPPRSPPGARLLRTARAMLDRDPAALAPAAVALLERAANQGEPDALAELGLLMETGAISSSPGVRVTLSLCVAVCLPVCGSVWLC